jgi:glycosyltransferase involved in cell wall biosynthesis
MARILHIIEFFSRGGGMRAMCGVAKYSAAKSSHQHVLISLNPALDDPNARALAAQAGMEIVGWGTQQEFWNAISTADIVQLNWWNSPVIDNFLRSKLPPCRLVTWLHVGGNSSPHIVNPELIRIADMTVPCSPHTALCPAIAELPDCYRLGHVRMAYGAADFARVSSISRKPHNTFNVGYIGTVHFLKMHPQYVRMSAAAKIPNARFIVCGSGGHEDSLRAKAAEIGRSTDFDIRGYVEDIAGAIGEFDAYGYPLCPETYAAAEVNLQEVMFAGVPPVVFPYGGLKELVVNNFTGLVVHSEAEYAQALEHLHRSPEDRARIGKNAAEYARQIFGSENAALVFDECYSTLMQQPKRARVWGVGVIGKLSNQQLLAKDLKPYNPALEPHERFIENLWVAAKPFIASKSAESTEQLAAEEEIIGSSEVLRSGLRSFARAFPNDKYLQLWYGLAAINATPEEAIGHLVNAVNLGLDHWRAIWYIALAAKNTSNTELARNAATKVIELCPTFEPARCLLAPREPVEEAPVTVPSSTQLSS